VLVLGTRSPRRLRARGRDVPAAARETDRRRSRKIRFINAACPGSDDGGVVSLRGGAGCGPARLVLVAMYLNDAQTAGAFYVRSSPPFSKSASSRGRRPGPDRRQDALPRGRRTIDPKWRESFARARDAVRRHVQYEGRLRLRGLQRYMDFGLPGTPGRGRSWTASWLLQQETARRAPLAMRSPVHIQVMAATRTPAADRCREICARRGIRTWTPAGVPAARQARREALLRPLPPDAFGYTIVAREILAA